ncbi:MAG: replication-associated recombination protein A [Planctomycetota bacterium]
MNQAAPLADRLRPRTADEVVGQGALLGPGTLLGAALATGEVPSLVLHGPPGCGKTTLGRLLADASGRPFEALSAVTSGVKDVREVIARARKAPGGRGVLLFVDEIHRFNRSQQDAFLPHIEDGTIVLVGATTENPGFALRAALLSRLRVVTLAPLAAGDLEALLDRALTDAERGLAGRAILAPAARELLVETSGGDARRLLNVLESACALAAAEDRAVVVAGDVAEASQRRVRAHDKAGDDRYDLLSAFHKALRGSDVDAALFWMARLLAAGEDPRVPARRLIAMASEDIGLADPAALRLALDAADALDRLGQPEGELALAHAVIYAALAPKSDSVVKALGAAREAAETHADASVPLHVRNAPTGWAKAEGHGAGYRYPHTDAKAGEGQAYLPAPLADLVLYRARPIGEEREVERRWRFWRKHLGRPVDEEGAR